MPRGQPKKRYQVSGPLSFLIHVIFRTAKFKYHKRHQDFRNARWGMAKNWLGTSALE